MTLTKTEVKEEKPSITKILAKKTKLDGFQNFLAKHSILTMALGVIIGQTTKDTVNSLVSGVITPALQLLMPQTKLQDLVVEAGEAKFLVGQFLNSFIEMLIILFIIYIVVGVIFKRKDVLGERKPKTTPIK